MRGDHASIRRKHRQVGAVREVTGSIEWRDLLAVTTLRIGADDRRSALDVARVLPHQPPPIGRPVRERQPARHSGDGLARAGTHHEWKHLGGCVVIAARVLEGVLEALDEVESALLTLPADCADHAAEKLRIIGKGSTNGINLARFNTAVLGAEGIDTVKKQLQYTGGCVYLLCIGRLVADKGIVELVQGFLQLSKQHTQLRLVLVGDFEDELDPLPYEVHRDIEQHPGIIHITWTQQVEYFMYCCDYFVFPSHREGFPNVLLQAGAMQLPVICSRITGNVDIVTHETTGLVFEKGHAAQMQQQLEYALLHPEKMKTMAAALHAIVQEDYKRENIWLNILSAYNSLLHLSSQ